MLITMLLPQVKYVHVSLNSYSKSALVVSMVSFWCGPVQDVHCELIDTDELLENVNL